MRRQAPSRPSQKFLPEEGGCEVSVPSGTTGTLHTPSLSNVPKGVRGVVLTSADSQGGWVEGPSRSTPRLRGRSPKPGLFVEGLPQDTPGDAETCGSGRRLGPSWGCLGGDKTEAGPHARDTPGVALRRPFPLRCSLFPTLTNRVQVETGFGAETEVETGV